MDQSLCDFPQLFPVDEHLLSDRDRRMRARVARHCTPTFPPEELIRSIGESTEMYFYFRGLLHTHFLVGLCDFHPAMHILEPGCGPGRNARALGPLLDPDSGGYRGFDVSESAITWCKESLTPLFPNVQFIYADIYNGYYNPTGAIAPKDYHFPYEDESFDIVFLPSVFTHMTRSGFERYLSEIYRVTKPGGRLLSWHFLMDPSTLEHIKMHRPGMLYDRYDEVSWVRRDLARPEEYVIYDTTYVLGILEAMNFTVQGRMRGDWAGLRPSGLHDHQDKILSCRR